MPQAQGTSVISSAGQIAGGIITNTHIASAAAIAYSKLNLTGLVVNADIAAAAAVAYSKLNLTDEILNADIDSAAAIAASKLAIIQPLLHEFDTDVTLVNTTTETDLLTFSLLADTLGTGNRIEILVFIDFKVMLGSAGFTIRLKYGSTEVATATFTNGSSGLDDWTGVIRAVLDANGDAAAQNGIIFGTVQGAQDVSPNYGLNTLIGEGSATEDSTGALTLRVTGQWAAASASNNFFAAAGHAKLISA